MLKDVAAGAAGAALMEFGKRAYGAYQDATVDGESDPLRDCMLALYGDPNAQSGTAFKEAESYLQSRRRLAKDTLRIRPVAHIGTEPVGGASVC